MTLAALRCQNTAYEGAGAAVVQGALVVRGSVLTANNGVRSGGSMPPPGCDYALVVCRGWC
jgi:hypothetical protein